MEFEDKKRLWIGGGSVVAGVALLIGYFGSGPDAMSFAEAENAFVKWEAKPEDDVLYKGMQSAVKNVPALQSKYEAVIAQKLLDLQKGEAYSLAKQTLNRVGNEAPFHSAYAKTSLLIQQGKFQKALEQAVALKEEMKGVASLKAGALLYAYNLLRIASLQHELKNKPGEKVSWEEFEGYLALRADLAHLLMSNFGGKEVTLQQYIAERKKQL